MNTEKKQRKIPLHVHKDRGDIMRKNGKLLPASAPRDRGDARRKSPKKISKQELLKTSKEESVKNDPVACSTNTIVDIPSSLEHRNADVSSEKPMDFRQRIKERYTFKRLTIKNDDNMSRFNNVMRYDVKNALPMLPYSEKADKQTSKDFQDAKKSDKTAVHRAVSVMKIKPNSKSDEAERKRSIETENTSSRKDKKTVIKTITSKMDTRVYKAVTFEEEPIRKPLQIKIPTKDVKPKPKMPACDQNNPVSTSKTTRSTKRVLRKRTPQPSPNFKSADSLPTEIAKWVPESVDQHTQPYYEAWVSKTATASTKLVEEASIEKSKVLRSMELEMKKSRELMYKKYAEEEYAGRIRVRRRGEK